MHAVDHNGNAIGFYVRFSFKKGRVIRTTAAALHTVE